MRAEKIESTSHISMTYLEEKIPVVLVNCTLIRTLMCISDVSLSVCFIFVHRVSFGCVYAM